MTRPADLLDGFRAPFRHGDGLDPIPGCKNPSPGAGLTAQGIDIAGINEAFAAQAIPCIEPLGLDPERVNVNRGAIAWGHPLGASGARLVLTMMIELEQSQRRLGLASMCIGVGQGISLSLISERTT